MATQFLCRLAKSDPEKRMLEDFPAVWEVTKDKKFVTARHSLQSIWKVGLAGTEQKEMVLKSLVDRFINCVHEDLIEKVEDTKYKKKYASVWKKA
jgi:hypothetical protein